MVEVCYTLDFATAINSDHFFLLARAEQKVHKVSTTAICRHISVRDICFFYGTSDFLLLIEECLEGGQYTHPVLVNPKI